MRVFLPGLAPVSMEFQSNHVRGHCHGRQTVSGRARAPSCGSRSSTPSAARPSSSTRSCWSARATDIKVGAPLLSGRQGHGDRAEARQGRQGAHREIPPPQALPAAGHASPAVHGSQDHRHQRGLSRRSLETLMAHKKAGGSTKNGRESAVEASRRQEVRRRAGARRQHPGPPARHHRIARATTSASARITRCSR